MGAWIIASSSPMTMTSWNVTRTRMAGRMVTDEQMLQSRLSSGRRGMNSRREGQPVGPDVSLIAGRPTIFAIRNEDSVAHDFISALFTRIEVHFTGRATGIFRKEAAGFRLKPGDSLTLQFILLSQSSDPCTILSGVSTIPSTVPKEKNCSL